MNEIDLLAFTYQWEQIDELIEKFRATKNKELRDLIGWLTFTLPYKDRLISRKGLYAWACLNHDKKIFDGLE